MILYKIDNQLEYNNDSTNLDNLTITFKLQRKLASHLFTTYFPSIGLMIVSLITLFIDIIHFEATIAVALTCMLVIYVLYQSISANLPHTSYMKMIDIWLFGNLCLPFIIIIILVIADYLAIHVNKEVTPMGIDKKRKWNSQTFLTNMRITMIITTVTLCVIYFMIALTGRK